LFKLPISGDTQPGIQPHLAFNDWFPDPSPEFENIVHEL
jgi:hypothetical protein